MSSGGTGAAQPSVGRSLRLFWVYTLGRFAVFGVLYLVLWAIGFGGLLGAAIAVVVSIPLSYVVLARPRAALAANIEQRASQRHAKHEDLSRKLSGDEKLSGDQKPDAAP